MSARAPELSGDVVELLGGPRASPVVAAVSGGSDSVALALVLSTKRNAGDLPPLHLAHLNHKIRGKEAEHDECFVRKLADRLSLPLTAGETDVPAAARERRVSLETAARECRYEFLEGVARELGARWVLLGHTADDQLETVLANLMRGAGIHGLAGMPCSRPIAPESRVFILRPLLEYPRGELIHYLHALGEAYCTDHTNLDTTYTRNRVRHELIPALEESWPTIRDDVTDFARVMGELDGLLEGRAREWVKTHAEAGNQGEVPLEEMNALEEPLLSYVIRRLIACTLGDLRRINEVHVKMIMELLAAGTTGASLDLPRRLVVRRGYGSLRFERGGRRTPESSGQAGASVTVVPPQVPQAASLAVPGRVCWGRWTFETAVLEGGQVWRELSELCGRSRIREFDNPPREASERMRVFIRELRRIDPEAVEYLDFDRVADRDLVVRSRRPGDRFTPLGAPGQKKLKDFLIRRKVPRAERDHIPIIVAGDEMLVVVGLGVANGAALTPDTRRVLSIHAEQSSG